MMKMVKDKNVTPEKIVDKKILDIVEIDIKNRQVLVSIVNNINILNNQAKMIMDTILNFFGVEVGIDIFELTKDCSHMIRKKAVIMPKSILDKNDQTQNSSNTI